MRRYPSKTELVIDFLVMIVIVLLVAQWCQADDQIETDSGQVLLISPLGFQALPELQVSANHLAELRIETESTFMPLTDGLEFRNHRIVDGYSICIFWSGSPRSIPFLCTPIEGEPFRFVVVVGEGDPDDPDDPVDPVDPEPTLNARAAAVRDEARKVKQPAVAQQIGDKYRAVADAIAAGTLTSLAAADSAIRDKMSAMTLDKKWERLGKAIDKAFDDQAHSLPDAQKLFGDVADGMHVAARWP